MNTDQDSLKKTPDTFEEIFPQGLVLKNLRETLGFEKPTPIQKATTPAILEGRDVYAGARTGSGKTFAFIAPLAHMIAENKLQKALVLCPTRELALQIDEEAMKIFHGSEDLCSCPLYGGVPLDQQFRAIQIHKPRLFIATPGRMIDFIQEGCLPLSEIEALVLDEADRMCDMGFSEQVEEILQTIPYRKQTMMFSATLPKRANAIMEKYLTDPVKVQVDDPNKASTTIKHRVVYVNSRDRIHKLKEFINEPNQTIVIFTRTRRDADNLFDRLKRDYSQLGILHAGYTMSEREKTIRAFREEKIQFLIATDVAARGLDIERITRVIHYDLPDSADDYIHRSGRSGRAGRDGETIALIDNRNFSQRRMLQELEKQITFETAEGDPEMGRSQSSSRNQKGRDRASGGRESSREKSNRRPRSNQKRSSENRERKPRENKTRERKPTQRTEKTENKGGSSSFFKKASKIIGGLFGSKDSEKKKTESSSKPQPRHKTKKKSNRRRGPRNSNSRNSDSRSSGNRGRSNSGKGRSRNSRRGPRNGNRDSNS